MHTGTPAPIYWRVNPYNYINYYCHGILALTLIVAVIYSSTSRDDILEGINRSGIWLLAIVMTLFIGTRPISGAFVDMVLYALNYESEAFRDTVGSKNDYTFNFIVRLLSGSFSANVFFLVCAAVYVAPLAAAVQHIHGRWGFPAFIALVGSFSFFNYGVNGIRNGMAASVATLAIAYFNTRLAFYLFAALAIGLHRSIAVTVVSFMVTKLVHKPAIYWLIWTTCLVACLIYGERASAALTILMPADDLERYKEYLEAAGAGDDKGGFRLDFVLYSIVPVIITQALATPKARAEPFYQRLLCTYLLSNAFWLMAMHVAFSNRFAYLSWCILPWVVIAPHLPRSSPAREDEPHSLSLLGAALVAHFAFTYTMHIFIYAR